MSSHHQDPFEMPAPEQSEPFDWRHYLHVVLERWWIVTLCLLLGGVLSAFLISREPSLYAARAVLFIEQQREQVLDRMNTVRDDQIRSVDMINTVVETLNSYPMAERVARRLELASDPAFRFAVHWDAAKDGEMTVASAAGYLPEMVDASYRKMTRLIDITARSTDPQLSVELANAYADEYLRMMLEQTTEATKSASQFLVEEAERLGTKMRVAEEAMQSFRERERAASLDTMLTEAQGTINQSTGDIQQVEGFIRQLNTDLAAVSSMGGDTAQILLLPSVASDQRVAGLNAQIEALERELDEMGRRYREGHPQTAAVKTRLDVLRGNQSALAFEVVSQLQARRDQAEAQLASLKEKRATAEKRLLEITGKSVEYNTLSRNLDADRALYQSVLARLKEVDVTSGLTDQSITVQERALGASPQPSKAVKYILLGVFGGLAVGVGIAFGLNKLDPSLRTIDQVEQRTGVGVMAAVPFIKAKMERGAGGTLLPAVADRRGTVAESFRTLRTTLALVPGREKNRVFLVTSALPAEGKTFVSCNFAATLAHQDFRTLIVDCDLRKPSVSRQLFNDNKKPGLSEVLMGTATLEEAITPSKVDNLSVLPAGGLAPNPSELLALPRLREMLETLKGKYDRIVVDSSPVLAVRDSLLVAPFVDATCLIVRAGRSPSKAVVHAMRLLADANASVAGIVINSIRQGRSSYYAYAYYRSYGGRYGAKGVYGAQPEKVSKDDKVESSDPVT